MDTNLIGTRELDNGLLLKMIDESRQIAADRWLVRVRFSVAVPVSAHYNTVPKAQAPSLADLVDALGDTGRYETLKERNFVSADEKDAVRDAIVAAYVNDAAPYLGRPSFPGKFLLKAYREHLSRVPLA